jgi:hypothetical protein
MFSIRSFLLPLLGMALVFGGGCMSSSKKKDYPVSVVRFLLESDSRESGILVRLPKSGVTIAVEPKSYFTEYDIEKCEVVDGELGKALAFAFTAPAGRDLYRISVPNRGKRIVTTLNGVPIGARRIDSAVSQNFWVTYVEVPETEVLELAKNITRTSVDLRAELEKKKK